MNIYIFSSIVAVGRARRACNSAGIQTRARAPTSKIISINGKVLNTFFFSSSFDIYFVSFVCFSFSRAVRHCVTESTPIFNSLLMREEKKNTHTNGSYTNFSMFRVCVGSGGSGSNGRDLHSIISAIVWTSWCAVIVLFIIIPSFFYALLSSFFFGAAAARIIISERYATKHALSSSSSLLYARHCV